MKCQICGRENASIHIREIKDGEKKSYYICKECAAKKGGPADIMGLAKIICDLTNSLSHLPQKNKNPPMKNTAPDLSPGKNEENTPFTGIPHIEELEIIQDLFGNAGTFPPSGEETDEKENTGETGKNLRCSFCGWGSEQLKKTGRMGCPDCYRVFASILEKELKKMHRGLVHAGKYPAAIEPELAKQVEEERAKCLFARGKNEELFQLQRDLENAVKQEDYEYAAILRDKIYSLQEEMRQDFFGGREMVTKVPPPGKKKAAGSSRKKKFPPETEKK